MKQCLLALVAVGLASCSSHDPTPLPPSLSLPLQGETWNLTQQTVMSTDHQSGVSTTSTTTAPAGAYSIRFDEKGKYHVTTGLASQEDYYAYDGKTITLQGAIGASTTRSLIVSAVTTSQLITVEDAENGTATYHTTSTFTR
jgi:hypothetical protein